MRSRIIILGSILGVLFSQNPLDNYLSGNILSTVVGNAQDGVNKPRDLDFHPTHENELWVLNEGFEGYDSDAEFSETVCVPENSDLSFNIYDSYGDGICCSYGNGSYTVSACGSTVASGGNFNSSESTSFTVGSCFSFDCDASEVGVNIEINTDNYGSETSWEVLNSSTNAVYGMHGAAGGGTVTFYNAGLGNQVSEYRQDTGARHFMNTASAFAFDNDGFFANSIDCKDGNNNADGLFAGPTLWDSDSTIYARVNQNGGGSHLDMLHQSPYGVGMEYDGEGNIYWLFDGYHSAIVRYDFRTPHEYGGDDHADGRVWRFSEINVSRDEGISSHLVMDDENRILYIVDSGNQRILKFNADSGQYSNSLTPYGENLDQYWNMSGAEWEVIIDSGLERPSGIDIYEDRLIVSDYATGDLIFYDLSVMPVTELGRLSTGNENSIMGIKISPDLKLWYANYASNELVRLDVNTMPGDVNFDEIVNILDIITIVNFILGTINPDPSQFSAADLNGDGNVNILDIINVVNIILDN